MSVNEREQHWGEKLNWNIGQQSEMLGQPMTCRSPRHRMFFFATLLFSVIFGADAFAQSFYKWKDAQGVTHYSETPPVKGSASQVQLTPDRQATSSAAPATSATSAEAEATALSKAEADYQKRACDAARSDVAAAKSSAILVNGKDATSAHRLSPEERVKAALEAQKRADKFCATGKKP